MNRSMKAGGAVVVLLAVEAGAHDRRELTLEQCLRIALEQNPGLSAARERVELSRTDLGEARSARYPKLDLQGAYFRIESPPTLQVLDQDVSLGRSDAFFFGLTASQTFYSGGAIESRVDAADETYGAEKEDLQSRAEQTAFQVHEAFYGVLLARELLEVREESLEQLRAHLEDARTRFRQGAASEFEALRAEVELANHRPLVVAAEHRLAGARDELTRLLGLDLSRPVDAVGRLEMEPWGGELEDAMTKALSRRAELKSAQARERAAAFAAGAARSGKKPSVSWFTSLFGTSPEYFIARDRDVELNWIGGVTVKLPLFDGFATDARIEHADARLRETGALRRDVEQEISLQVREAYRGLVEAEATIEAQARVIEQAERALAIARVRYTSGLGTELEVTDAQLALSQARVLRLQAIYTHAVARAGLRRATGESLLPGGELPPGSPG